MTVEKLTLAAALLLGLAACGDTQGERTLTGALGGAVAGEVIAGEPVAGAAIGGLAGALR
jgi:osmotically inducible lipoprotein OsmB